MQAPALKPRILSVDALRGFALFGIFFSHMIFWYAGGPLPETYYRAYSGIASMVSVGLYFLLFNAKFFAIFAFLFGVSFHIQITNLAARSTHPGLRFAWRLAILGCLGALHHMFWRADILSVYAIVGLLLIPARKLTNKTLAVAGMLLVFNLPSKLIELGWMLAGLNLALIDPKLAQDAQAYYFAFTQANFAQMLSHNLWLNFFQYGPLEWFWRCTTDLRWRALRYPGNAINY